MKSQKALSCIDFLSKYYWSKFVKPVWWRIYWTTVNQCWTLLPPSHLLSFFFFVFLGLLHGVHLNRLLSRLISLHAERKLYRLSPHALVQNVLQLSWYSIVIRYGLPGARWPRSGLIHWGARTHAAPILWAIEWMPYMKELMLQF